MCRRAPGVARHPGDSHPGPAASGPPYGRPALGPSPWAQVLLGGLIGLVLGVGGLVLVVIVIVNVDAQASGTVVLGLGVLVPLLLPTPLLFFRQTRMWAVGLMIGCAVSSIGLAGTCVLIANSLSGAAA